MLNINETFSVILKHCEPKKIRNFQTQNSLINVDLEEIVIGKDASMFIKNTLESKLRLILILFYFLGSSQIGVQGGVIWRLFGPKNSVRKSERF